MQLAPVILFVYNRPLHTLETLQALAKNILFYDSTLIIYSDGPKNTSKIEIDKINEVRKVLKQKKWSKKVIIHENTVNKGLATSVIDGVSETINLYGKVIVIEDDLICGKGFIEFMNKALNNYENISSVMSVSGYVFPNVYRFVNSPFFIFGGTSTWGWGTWKRAWEKLNLDGQSIREEIKSKGKEYEFNFQDSYPYMKLLNDQINGIVSSWGILWYASVFLNKGLGLFPNKSLIKNIGWDGSGTHSSQNKILQNQMLSDKIILSEIPIEENLLAKRAFIEYYTEYHNKTKQSKSMINYFRRLLNKFE